MIVIALSKDGRCHVSLSLRRVGCVVGSTLLILSISLVGASAANATDDDDAIRELVALQPGSDAASIIAAATQYAKASGISIDEALARGLSEARTYSGPDVVPFSSPGTGQKRLSNAPRVGDIFHEPTSPANHVGIYTTTAAVTEAVGSGVRVVSTVNRPVNLGTKKYYVSVSQSNRNLASAWARARVGAGYNYSFAFNKNSPSVTAGTKYNCSQLVWAAYLNRAGIDLDSNGGPGVCPDNVRDSGWLRFYANN